MTNEEKAATLESLKKYTEAARQRQKELFKSLCVDERITVFGQQVGCECQWTVTVADMARFGITNATAPENYGKDHEWMEIMETRTLALADYPDYAKRLRE